MAGIAAEVFLTILAAIVLLPLGLGALFMLDRIDAEGALRTTSSQRAEGRTWPQRAAGSLQWIIPGLLVAAVIGVGFADGRVWAGIGLYVACNLGGTQMLLSERELGPKATATVKALFIFQIPLGLLFMLGNGL